MIQSFIMVNRVKKIIWKLYDRLTRLFLSLIIPINSKVILFGARHGKFYMDNSRYLYEWAFNHREDLKPIWLTHSSNVYNRLKGEGKPVVMINSYKGFLLQFRAKAACITNDLSDFSDDKKMIPKKLAVVFLGHGKSVKGSRLAINKPSVKRKWENRLQLFRNITKYAIATSQFIADLTEKSQGVTAKITGYPRNDQLISPSDKSIKDWKLFVKNTDEETVNILYAPSWRIGENKTKFFPFEDFDSNQLISFLEEKNITLYLRPHIKDLYEVEELKLFIEDLKSKSQKICLTTNHEFEDVNDILPFMDMLITDYSSIYHDYLLLNNPIIFFPYDYKEFEKENGFVYDYYENLPGAAIHSFQSLCVHLEQLINGDDNYVQKRKNLSQKIHKYTDDRSCERVIELIENI